MHKARAFFFVCAGLFLLALSYHLGARNAGAQAPGNPVVASIPTTFFPGGAVITANGDIYATGISGLDHGWTFKANIFAGGATPVQQETWGRVKRDYRGAAQPAPTGR
jgi:hypothetical protein